LWNDPLIKELYDDDVAVYIGSWEIVCPHCKRWTPLVGNWWLARVKGKGGYKRLAWMEPEIQGDEVKIRVVDLNKKLGDKAVRNATVRGNAVSASGQKFTTPQSNINARREQAICLLCGQPIMQIDPETGKHYTETKNLPSEVKNRLEGYVKFTLKLYNQGASHGEINPPEWAKDVSARLRLLTKVKTQEGDLAFEPCTEEDQKKLERAKQEIEKLLQQGDPGIPTEPISPYSARYLFPILYGMTEWYKLFNPRQLLTLVKLVKLIREAGKKSKKKNKKKD
jgi:putative DNA methylase